MGCALALAAAAPALAQSIGHSQLVPLPTVSPPTPLHRQMHWARRAPAPAAVETYAGGLAVAGLEARVEPHALARSLGLHLVLQLPKLRLVELAGSPAALAALATKGDPRVRYIEPLHAVAPAHVRNDPLSWQIDARSGVPYEWAFHQTGVDQALNLTQGDPSILVGVVDSGIGNVPDLRGKVAETFWDARDNISADDSIGHGTFVSSIIASANDDGFGLAGFCGACRLAVYKAIPLTDVEIAEGIQRLTDAHVRVINLSLVSTTVSQDIIDALNYATGAGVLVVAATGNEGLGTVDFPASFIQPQNGTPSSGIAVGAADASGNRAPFSNSGSQLSLLAPGSFDQRCTVGVLGALPAFAGDFDSGQACDVVFTDPQGNRYAYASGTSFAAPAVAGVAALVWAAQPSLTSVQVANVLEQTATRVSGTGWNATAGWGVLNAKAALESVTGRSSADALVLSRLHVAGVRRAGSALRVTVGASWADASPVIAGATPSCHITVGGNAVRSHASLATGVLTCAFTLPRGSAGARVTGTVTLTAALTPPATASFAFAVR